MEEKVISQKESTGEDNESEPYLDMYSYFEQRSNTLNGSNISNIIKQNNVSSK